MQPKGDEDMPKQQHVPAWKKLGLKLKYARDSSEQVDDKANVEANTSKKRKRDAGKLPSDAPVIPSPSVNREALLSTPGNVTSTPLPKKRKSVAFTPETKVDDGDSTKQLYDRWLAEQLAKDSTFSQSALGPAFQTVERRARPELSETTSKQGVTEANSSEEKVKKSPKKKKKKKKTNGEPLQKQNGEAGSGAVSSEHEKGVPPAITYLLQYHGSRPSWKFNKAKQTWLLKHLFDIDEVPSVLDPALSTYMQGLQGANAREKLQKAAQSIREEDEKQSKEALAADTKKASAPMEDPVRRQEYYDQALRHYQAQVKGQVQEQQVFEAELDPVWRRKLLRRKRAEMVLWSLSPTDADSNGGPKAPPQRSTRDQAEGGTAKKAKLNDGNPTRRRRKRRTGIPDDDDSTTSSSSSSSSSESSSDEDDDDDSSTSESSSEDETSSGSDAETSSDTEEDAENAEANAPDASSSSTTSSSSPTSDEGEAEGSRED